YRPDATQYGAGVHPHRVVNHQAVKAIHPDISVTLGHCPEHLQALIQTEQGLLFRIAQDGHDQLVENLAAPLDEIQMPVRERVKRARIDSNDRLQSASAKKFRESGF